MCMCSLAKQSLTWHSKSQLIKGKAQYTKKEKEENIYYEMIPHQIILTWLIRTNIEEIPLKRLEKSE